MRAEATVTEHDSRGSIWATGDAVWGYELNGDRWRYVGLLCIRAREVGPRGGIRRPARSAIIAGPTWASVRRAVSDLGFTMPRLSAEQVRLGNARKAP